MGQNSIFVNRAMPGVTISASGSYTTQAFDLNEIKPNGYFGLQVTVSGSGTCKFEYLCSIDGVNFVEPTGATDIASGVTTVTSALTSFTPAPCRYIKIKCTETGGANSVTVTAWLCIQ